MPSSGICAAADMTKPAGVGNRRARSCCVSRAWAAGSLIQLERIAAIGGFCCKSQLRQAAKRDSVVMTRFSVRSIHDGPSEE